MNKKENYTFLQILNLMMVIFGLWHTIDHDAFGPILAALGVMFINLIFPKVKSTIEPFIV